jgi:putative multiple sugar transport system ATP-binding protein
MSVFGKIYGRGISGSVYLDGKEVKLNSVQDAINNKLAYVTEDRKTNGLILSNPIRVNVTLANLSRISSHGAIDSNRERTDAEEYKDMLNVKCNSIEQLAGSLSGGNQQKVLLSKWMYAQPEFLILDEPTRGIDVGAKYEIYTFINQLVAQNKSVLMISSEMPEILGMCDRIYVMNEGRIVAEYSRDEASQEKIMSSILRASAS